MNSKAIILQIGDRYIFEFMGKRNDLALFAILGNALAAIQSFEMGISIYLNILSKGKSSNFPNSDCELERFYSLTLGVLIKQFQQYLPNSGVASILENVREKRNYLVHRVLRVYQWPLMSGEEYVRAIHEIDEIREYIENAEVEVSRYLSDQSLVNLIVISIENNSGEISRKV
jgi:hypothetical protein